MLAIQKFWTVPKEVFEDDPANPGKKISRWVEEDWVAYGPAGSLDRSVNKEKVSRLAKVQVNGQMSNPAVALAHARWDTIRPAYEAWKAGREAPEDGTPLSAWTTSGMSDEFADVLRAKSVKTVEALAALNEAHISRLAIPGLRGFIQSAQRFVASADSRSFAENLAEKEREIHAQQARMDDVVEQNKLLAQRIDEMATMIASQQAERAEPKRGPGRPRKEAAEAENEAA
jgi:hypothetical protein